MWTIEIALSLVLVAVVFLGSPLVTRGAVLRVALCAVVVASFRGWRGRRAAEMLLR